MRKEKVLILASVASMIDQFNIPNIDILVSLGYEVHVACNFEQGNTCSKDKINQLKNKLEKLNIKYYQIDFTRSVYNLLQDIKSYNQVKKIMIENKYKFIHCHSPIGGVIGRLVSKKTKTKCIYTAHGFHFYKGAPIQNWIIFYPIEKWLSKYTDILITINKEDYKRAKNKFKMKVIRYVPGVGVDTEKFLIQNFDRQKYRKKLGYSNNDFIILSVGELNKNKNHEIVLKAIAQLKNSKIKYMIAGNGELKEKLLNTAESLGIRNQFQLLGFRKDIPELLNSSDLYILPSLREGLNVSLMEAMSANLPVIASDIRGNVDLIKHKTNGFLFNPSDCNLLSLKINTIYTNTQLSEKISIENHKIIQKFDSKKINQIMIDIYKV